MLIRLVEDGIQSNRKAALLSFNIHEFIFSIRLQYNPTERLLS